MKQQTLVALASAAILSCCLEAHAATQVFFEDFEALPNNGSFKQYDASNAADKAAFAALGAPGPGADYGPWRLSSGNVDAIFGGYGAITGTSIDMHGTMSGFFYRTVDTVAGAAYTLEFDRFVNPNFGNYSSNGPALNITVRNNITGFLMTTSSAGVTQFPSFSPDVLWDFNTNNWKSYVRETLTFTGDGTTHLLGFSGGSIGQTASGATLDNIRLSYTVSAIPEPSEWAMMLGGLVAVAAIAKRRKAKSSSL